METYRKTLNEVVKKDTSGDYGKLLLAIIGDESVTITEPPQQVPAADAQAAPTTQEQPVGVRLCTLPCVTTVGYTCTCTDLWSMSQLLLFPDPQQYPPVPRTRL